MTQIKAGVELGDNLCYNKHVVFILDSPFSFFDTDT